MERGDRCRERRDRAVGAHPDAQGDRGEGQEWERQRRILPEGTVLLSLFNVPTARK